MVSEKIPSGADTTLVIALPTHRYGTEGEVYELLKYKQREYEQSYPNVNVLAELKKMKQWLTDNPSRRKTANGMTAFINRWLSKATNTQPNTQQNTSGGMYAKTRTQHICEQGGAERLREAYRNLAETLPRAEEVRR